MPEMNKLRTLKIEHSKNFNSQACQTGTTGDTSAMEANGTVSFVPDSGQKRGEIWQATILSNCSEGIGQKLLTDKVKASLYVGGHSHLSGKTLQNVSVSKDGFMNKNVNKQQIDISEKIQSIFPYSPETWIGFDNNKSIQQLRLSIRAMESENAKMRKPRVNEYKLPPSAAKNMSDYYFIQQRSLMSEQFQTQENEFPASVPKSQQIDYTEESQRSTVSTYKPSLTATCPTDSEDKQTRMTPLTSCPPRESFSAQESSKDEIDNMPIKQNTNMEDIERVSIQLDKSDSKEYAKFSNAENGLIGRSDHPPHVRGHVTFGDTPSWPSHEPAKNVCGDILFDDSVLPSQHSLGTSKDLTLAMTRGRKKRNYTPCLDNILQNPRTRFAIVSNDSFYDRFPHTANGSRYTKYRQIMSTIHRNLFNQWKAETTARAGQRGFINVISKQPKATNKQLLKSLPDGCPCCLQFNMSNIHSSRPCLCCKLPKGRIMKPSNNKNPSFTRGIQKDGSLIGKNKQVKTNKTVSDDIGLAVCLPSCIMKNTEHEAGRNLVTIGLLGGTLQSSHETKSCPNIPIRGDNLANVSTALPDFNETVNEIKYWETMKRVQKALSRSLKDGNKSVLQMDNKEIINPIKTARMPLPDWDTKTLKEYVKKSSYKKPWARQI